MAEPVGCRLFFEPPGKRKYPFEPAPPSVGDCFQASRFSADERCPAVLLGPFNKPVAEPIGDIGEYVSPVLLRTQKNLVALQALHVEQRDIGYSQARISQRPDKILRVFARPCALPLLIDPLDRAKGITGVDDALKFLVGERDFICNPAGAKRRFQVTGDGVFLNPLAGVAEAEECPQSAEAFCLRADAKLEPAIEHVHVGGADLAKHHVAAR